MSGSILCAGARGVTFFFAFYRANRRYGVASHSKTISFPSFRRCASAERRGRLRQAGEEPPVGRYRCTLSKRLREEPPAGRYRCTSGKRPGRELPASRYRCTPSKGRGRNRLPAGIDIPLAGGCAGRLPSENISLFVSAARPGAGTTRPTSGRFGLRAVSPRRCLCRDIPFRSFGLQNAAPRWTAPHPAKKMQSSEFCGDRIWGMFTRTKPLPQPAQKREYQRESALKRSRFRFL